MRIDLIAAMVRKAGRPWRRIYKFEVAITAVVQVRAESESQARKVVLSSALASQAPKTSGWPTKLTS
jgi:hypothetical protein